jgi:asparagine synthase (glutamine-hydrolysing)
MYLNTYMCGIWFYLSQSKTFNTNYVNYSNNVQHRGPDETVSHEFNNIQAVFHRLSIIDINHGHQPFIYDDKERFIMVMCNGEIYNYQELYLKLLPYKIIKKTDSDCEVILHLYMHFKNNFVHMLNGEFAFCIYDYSYTTDQFTLLYARDRFGIRPLFIGYYEPSSIILSSVMKGLPLDAERPITQVPPRTLFIINNDLTSHYIPYFSLDTLLPSISDKYMALDYIRATFTKAVTDRLMTSRPFGCLLSGGLDSSLICGIVAQWCKIHKQTLYTFSIGLEGSTDEIYANKVAQFIQSEHTHVKVSINDFINAIPDVIKAIESYDITTVRASVGQYLLGKYISNNTQIKVLLIGDGADELCGGYRYLYNAPSVWDFHNECITLLNEIHYFDVLRADRGLSAHGLEARVPFLDHEFATGYLSVVPELRMPNISFQPEKKLLRDAFLTANIIPMDVLLRKKEAFSDGVSSIDNSWYSIIQNHVNKLYSDDCVANNRYITNRPMTKEALYYRDTFDKFFHDYENTGSGMGHIIPHFWLPKWSGNITEPSARVLKNY